MDLAQLMTGLLDRAALLLQFLATSLAHVLLSPGGMFSLASLASALVIAVLFLSYQHRHRQRPIRLRVLARAIFPRRLIRSRSTKADLGFFLFNALLGGILFGWAILSTATVSHATTVLLASALGAPTPIALSDLACAGIMTVAMFVAYEFGYWLDHYLSHRIPFLWEFHKVHHTAEVLSPLTNFRVHPVDSVVFINILAITMGATSGLLIHLFGKPITSIALWNINAIILLFTYLLDHLHHTQFWIPFTGPLGKIFVSPAHHQIHHSTNPVHFNKNLGSCLAIFDWLFGTLHMPQRQPERLTFGVEPRPGDPHSITGGLIAPVQRALGHLTPAGRDPEADAAAHPSGQTPPRQAAA